MEDNNYNSDPGWKQKLAALQQDDDNSFSKETAWNKLYERLHQKRARKKLLWYRMAAASILIILIVSLFISKNKNEQVLVQQYPAVKSNSKQASDTRSEVNNKIEHQLPIVIVNTIPPPVVKKQLQKRFSNKRVIQLLASENKSGQLLKTAIRSNATQSVDTAIIAITTIPVKKKLKVVHANELGDPATEQFQFKKPDDFASSSFKFINQQMFTNLSPDTRTDHKIFSIRTNSNN